ncbi:hypothetical protein [Streptomyces microflavus]
MDRPWTADLGDGTCRNPVLNADFASPRHDRGALLGLFATAPAGAGPAGTARFTAFRTTDPSPPASHGQRRADDEHLEDTAGACRGSGLPHGRARADGHRVR